MQVERVKSTFIKTKASNRLACNNKVEATAEQGDVKKTQQARKRVSFDCGRGGPTTCGGCDDERGE